LGKLQNLYSTKLENREEMDKFLDGFKQSKLNQEETNLLNKSIASSKD
jgi:hypothetical protein